MKRYQDNTFVVGNIGTPYTQEVLKTDKDSVTVAEISSFQLETAVHFHPTVSAILNITPDHLNRHHTMENYAAVKESITKNQTKDDFCAQSRGQLVKGVCTEVPASRSSGFLPKKSWREAIIWSAAKSAEISEMGKKS